jgi:hypothetical protein
MTALPVHVTPDQLAQHLGVSERTLREQARNLGACRIIGKKMILLESDVDLIMEATRSCRSQYTSGAKSGTTGAPLPDGDYAALQAQRKKRLPKGSQPMRKPKSGVVISMDQGRK